MKVSRRWFLAGGGALLGSAYLAFRNARRPAGPWRVIGAPTLATPVAPSLAPGSGTLGFYAVGDTGLPNEPQRAVAASMAAHASLARPDFVLMLGDNFYGDGVTSTEDDIWRTHFEEPFAALQIPFRPCLGNHDHNGNIQAQVEYGWTHPRWAMPARYYSFSHKIGSHEIGSHEAGADDRVDFFVLDTQPLRLKDMISDSQVRWLEDQLARSTARWKIVAGHHPLHSNTNKGGSSVLRRRIGPLFEEYGVDLYLAGHCHVLELLRPEDSWLQVVSGSGCHVDEHVYWRENTLFAAAQPGYAWVIASRDELWIQFITAEGGLRFSHRVEKT